MQEGVYFLSWFLGGETPGSVKLTTGSVLKDLFCACGTKDSPGSLHAKQVPHPLYCLSMPFICLICLLLMYARAIPGSTHGLLLTVLR